MGKWYFWDDVTLGTVIGLDPPRHGPGIVTIAHLLRLVCSFFFHWRCFLSPAVPPDPCGPHSVHPRKPINGSISRGSPVRGLVSCPASFSCSFCSGRKDALVARTTYCPSFWSSFLCTQSASSVTALPWVKIDILLSRHCCCCCCCIVDSPRCVSGGQQSESVVYIYLCVFFGFFSILGYHKRLG